MDAQLLPTAPALSCGGLELVVVVFFLIIPILLNLLFSSSILRTRFSLKHLLDYFFFSVQTTLETCVVVIITTSMHFHFAQMRFNLNFHSQICNLSHGRDFHRKIIEEHSRITGLFIFDKDSQTKIKHVRSRRRLLKSSEFNS